MSATFSQEIIRVLVGCGAKVNILVDLMPWEKEVQSVTQHKAKLVHVCNAAFVSKRLILPQALYFQSLGYNVGFIHSQGKETALLKSLGFFVEEIHIDRSIRLGTDISSIYHVSRYLQRIKPDIVHTHTSKGGIIGRVAARLAGIPAVIHTAHGFSFDDGMAPLQFRLLLSIERFAARISDAILTQSQEDVENGVRYKVLSRSGAPQCIGNGIDVERFNPARFPYEKRRAMRMRLSLADNVIVLICVARLTKAKGHQYLIEALRTISSEKWHLLLVGDDEGEEATIRQAAVEEGISDRVTFLGARDDVAELLSIADIAILPSVNKEGMPRSLIEAQAMEVPCVATNIRGSREVVQDGETGIIVEPRNPPALAGAIIRLINDNDLRRYMGKAGRRRVLSYFDETLVFQRIADVYEKLLSRKGREAKRI